MPRHGPCSRPTPRRCRRARWRGFVDRPQKFLALHFAIGVWDSNIGEVMGHPGTDTAVFEGVLEFAEEIGLVPIPIRKEQSGYIINSLLVPWCTAALELLVRGVSDVQSIDRTWMITLRSGMGPFGMMDRMGLGVVHHVASCSARPPRTPRRSSPPATSTSTSSRRATSASRAARASTAIRIRPSTSRASSEGDVDVHQPYRARDA